ncbi:MAG: hypothetical protein LC789_00570 [Actinobacteria bacterium]|nr:hypothetical protein [Actinomycetota bacterium]MCA1719740.1 hypothetical protein [Actinomycetota bacterium]
MYNPETIESLLAYPGRHSRPATSISGFDSSRRPWGQGGLRARLRKVRKAA